jgi:hypothetical protein
MRVIASCRLKSFSANFGLHGALKALHRPRWVAEASEVFVHHFPLSTGNLDMIDFG